MNKVFGPVFDVSRGRSRRHGHVRRARQAAVRSSSSSTTRPTSCATTSTRKACWAWASTRVEHWNPDMAEDADDPGALQVRELPEGDLPRQRHQGRAAVGRALRRSELVAAVQRPDRATRARDQQDRRHPPHVRAHRDHARQGRLDGRSGPGHRRAASRTPGSATPSATRFARPPRARLAPGRREAGLSVLREGAQVRHQHTSASTRACCRATTRSPGPACGSTPRWTTCRKAAKDWPGLRTSSSTTARCARSSRIPHYELDVFEKTGDIHWVTDLARIPQKFGVNNVYAELGTTFATAAVTNPRFAAAVIGPLVNLMGADRVVWGTDSVWYGSPQWQIEAMRRLEIPDDIMKKHGWKTKLGGADSEVKRKIFGVNSAQALQVQDQGRVREARHRQAGADEGGLPAAPAWSATTPTTATSASAQPPPDQLSSRVCMHRGPVAPGFFAAPADMVRRAGDRAAPAVWQMRPGRRVAVAAALAALGWADDLGGDDDVAQDPFIAQGFGPNRGWRRSRFGDGAR